MLLPVRQFIVLRICFEQLEGSLCGAQVFERGLPDEGVSRVAAGDRNQTLTAGEDAAMLECRKFFLQCNELFSFGMFELLNQTHDDGHFVPLILLTADCSGLIGNIKRHEFRTKPSSPHRAISNSHEHPDHARNFCWPAQIQPQQQAYGETENWHEKAA